MREQLYAPVIIPTLNRFEHFRHCLESLERCTGADQTDVLVGLDYPPSEKYVEGWKKIDAYLIEKEKKNGFRNLYVTRRNHNCGVKGLNSNYRLLVNEVKTISDRFISTEDDNEFSQNFLDYMNKGLEKYKDDLNVFSISGYNYPISMVGYDKNVYSSYHFSAWGCGFWKDKMIVLTKEELIKFIFAPSHFFKLLIRFPMRLLSLFYMFAKHEIHGDACYEIYCFVNNWVSIFPTVSKVRNWGHDGSGLHGKINPEEDLCYNQEIDTATTFEFDDIPLKDFEWKPLRDYFHKPLGWYVKKIYGKIVHK